MEKKTRLFEATDDNLESVQGFVDEAFLQCGGNDDNLMMLEIAVEEIFVNISHYAYDGETGQAEITVGVQNGDFFIRFADTGMPFDPLAHVDPDVTKLAQSNKIGGLGIYMVKKYMDDVIYRYENGYNILTLLKRL